MRVSWLLLLLQSSWIRAYYSPHFNRFLTKMFEPAGQRLLERSDFGAEGSFGGRTSANHKIRKQPVIIVHGVTNVASKFYFVRDYLLRHGYTDAEIYATTYGDGYRKFVLFVKLQCQYVRQIRALIQAVYYYTNSVVDVLAFSMGSPLARKAILGGFCEGDYIGPALTYMVDTFVGVAGANYGASRCIVPFWVCSRRNGLHCKSKFLNEINNQPGRFEGAHSYAIYSDADDKVGIQCCNHRCSSLPHSETEIELHDYDHDQVMVASLSRQLQFIQNHTISN